MVAAPPSVVAGLSPLCPYEGTVSMVTGSTRGQWQMKADPAKTAISPHPPRSQTYMVAAPLLFAADDSRITLGILVQISNAFGKVFDSFNTVADNWMSVNEWRSVLVRLREFERSHYQNGSRARLGDHPVAHVVQMEVVSEVPEPPHSPPPPRIPPSAAPPMPYMIGDGACD